MKYVAALIISVFSVIIAYCTLDENISNKIIFLKRKGNEVFQSKKVTKLQIKIIGIIIFILNVFCVISIMTNVDNYINIIKMIVTIFCVTGAACNDYREHRIPNIFPLVIAVTGIVCLTVGYFTGQQGAQAYIVSSVFATTVVALSMVVVYFLTKHGIGMGDIKLLCALSIVGGVYLISGTIFFAMIACSVTAIILLIMKKKTIKDGVPFGPFIYMGYIVSILFSVY